MKRATLTSFLLDKRKQWLLYQSDEFCKKLQGYFLYIQFPLLCKFSYILMRKSTPLHMIFSVTYYLELHNAISITCTSHILPTNVKMVVLTSL